MPTLLIATTNQNKLREYAAIFAGLPFELRTLRDLGIDDDVEETGATFAENARLKAEFYAARSGLPALADDSGLEVHALGGPRGSFGWREHKSNLLCIAGGSGMAPIKGMLEDAAQKKMAKRIVYLFGARTEKDLYALDDMQKLAAQLKLDFVPVLSHEDAGSSWKGARGFVTEFIDKQALDFKDTAAFLCGPPPMIDAAIAKLNELGIGHQDIFFDKFTDKSHVNK